MTDQERWAELCGEFVSRDVLLSQLKAKDERIAVLEAFVREFDAWVEREGSHMQFRSDTSAELFDKVDDLRCAIGKVGGKSTQQIVDWTGVDPTGKI